MWTKICLSILLTLLIVSFTNAAGRITALEWVESIANTPGITAYKTLLYEANNYIGPFTEEYLAHMYQADSHMISMDMICGYSTQNVKSAFEYVDYYLQLARLYYLQPYADDILWVDGSLGKLKKNYIIDLINEINALQLFETLVDSLPDVVCMSRSCPASKGKTECLDSYRQISQLIMTWVRFIGTQQEAICNGTVVFDPTAVTSPVDSNASLALAKVYLQKSLMPFLQDRMCNTYQVVQSAWNLTLVASYVSDFVVDVNPLGTTTSSSVPSLPDQLHVVDRAFNYSASYDDCFAIVGKYRTLPAVDEVHSCYTFIRDFLR